MQKFIAHAPVYLHSGSVKISDDQYKRRAHQLQESKGKGVYEIVRGPVCFKAGEEFGYSGDIPKSMADIVADAKTGKTIAQQRVELKAEAKAGKKNMRDDAIEAIGKVLGLLDPQNPEHFTNGGKPEVKAIEAILEIDITAAERDAAWDKYQAEQESGDGTGDDIGN